MKLHGNARLSPFQREPLCRRVEEEGWTVREAAEAAGCSVRSAYTRLSRWRAGDPMTDRSSAPRTVAATPAETVEAIEALRRLRMTSTAIAARLSLPVSTVCAVLARLGLNRLSRLGPPEPPNRYCRRHAGELVHVDDATRLACVEVLPDETAATAVAFLERAVAWLAERGVGVRQVMTDNGSAYRSARWAAWCAARSVEHIRTRPSRPRTNGKAERFIQTMLREWAYAAVYRDSGHRARALRPWLRYYNERRPHGALGHRTPASRLAAEERS